MPLIMCINLFLATNLSSQFLIILEQPPFFLSSMINVPMLCLKKLNSNIPDTFEGLFYGVRL
ncbi:MAG: hypothetical protein CVU61_09560 [Deltaproteobacteria bacterium HGW-Deltaproteobacteria-19]|nr:MAG: hypothetical protein CVU61_09560 [Deltaproteobacteria bacterium HGW-Deltaproteobacteria-19]